MNFLTCVLTYLLNQVIMKKLMISIFVSGILLFVFQSFMIRSTPGLDMPDDVQEILKTSCYDCHTSASSNKKGKAALNFDKWDEYKDSKKVGKLDAICEVVSKDKMPPEKYLKNSPEKALSDDQKVLLCSWADKAANKLMEGN